MSPHNLITNYVILFMWLMHLMLSSLQRLGLICSETVLHRDQCSGFILRAKKVSCLNFIALDSRLSKQVICAQMLHFSLSFLLND